jgi:hypothetical protein
MPATLATIDSYLKEVYTGKIRRQLNDEITTLKRVTRSGSGVSAETNGKYVTFPVHVRRNAGIGSRNEMDALPVPGQQGYAAARLALKSAYGGLQITGQAIDMADTDPKAFAKSIDEEMDRLKVDVRKDMNRQIYGDGSGAISTIRSVVTSATLPVVDARLFQLGEVVDVYTLPSTLIVAGRSITAIDLTAGANTVTISGAAIGPTVVGQVIVRTGSLSKEITGFASIVAATGILYNINPTTEPEWTAEVDANGGTPRALSEGLMQKMVDRIRTRGGKTTVIFQSLGVRRSYANLLLQLRQVVNSQNFTGGFSGLAFTTDSGEIPVIADIDAPLGKQWFINEEALTFYRDEEWHWLDRAGSMFQQVRDTNGVYDAWYAHLVERHELGTDRRNTHGLISDLIES